jgi:tRNA(fMet)-specific endonuclease VapC
VSKTALFLLDTNITGYIIRGRSEAARQKLKETREEAQVVISTVTEAEILYGLELRPEAARLRAAVSRLFESLEVRTWDSAAARAYATLRAKLKTAGKTLAEMDLMIAAHALAEDAVLVSHDRAFLQVAPFMRVVDWAIDIE